MYIPLYLTNEINLFLIIVNINFNQLFPAKFNSGIRFLWKKKHNIKTNKMFNI